MAESKSKFPHRAIERRLLQAVPTWKMWPRRLRRIYVSLEDWGCSESAVRDMVEQWGWEWGKIAALIKHTPTFSAELGAYRDTGEYPNPNNWRRKITADHFKIVYIREGELSSFAALDENPKAINFHQGVIADNDMLGFSQPFPARQGLQQTINGDREEAIEEWKGAGSDSGLASFHDTPKKPKDSPEKRADTGRVYLRQKQIEEAARLGEDVEDLEDIDDTR